MFPSAAIFSFILSKEVNIDISWLNSQGPVESADHLPPTLKKTIGKTLYEKLDAKITDGTKVSISDSFVSFLEPLYWVKF